MAKNVVIVGGGHNGLVCSCYLAKAGFSVTVLERRGILGGAAVTEEFHPGFRNSVASYTVSLLHPRVIDDLHLHRHGLEILECPINNFLPLPDDNSLTSFPDPLKALIGFDSIAGNFASPYQSGPARDRCWEAASMLQKSRIYTCVEQERTQVEVSAAYRAITLQGKSSAITKLHCFSSRPCQASGICTVKVVPLPS